MTIRLNPSEMHNIAQAEDDTFLGVVYSWIEKVERWGDAFFVSFDKLAITEIAGIALETTESYTEAKQTKIGQAILALI